jgi:hypothetical protein
MAGEKPQKSPDSTEREVPFLKVTLNRSHIVGKSEKDCTSRFSLKQKFAALALLAGMSGFAYCHNTAEAPASSKTTATAEPFETPDQPAKFVLKGNEVNFMTDDGEVDVEKVNQQVLSGIAARFDEMHDPTEVDHYHYATDRSLIVSKTNEEDRVDDSLIITTERGATPGHPGRETVTTTIYHEQRDQKTNKTATLDRVVLVTPDMPEGAGEEQPFGRITSQGFRDLLKNPKTQVDMAKSYDPNADGSDQTIYMEIKRTTSGQGKPTFITHEVSQSSNGSDHNYTWQPKKPEDASRVIRYWCL